MVETAKNDDTKNSVEVAHGSPVLVNWKCGWRRTLKWYVIVFGPISIVLLWRLACIGRYWEGDLLSIDLLILAWTLLAGGIAWLIGIDKILQTPESTGLTKLKRCAILSVSIATLTSGAFYLSAVVDLHTIRVLTSRLDPVVDAAGRYYKDHGKPPKNFQELVPGYIDHLPTDAPELGFGMDLFAEKDSWTACFHLSWAGDVYFSPTMKYDSFDRPASPGFPADLAPRVGRWVIHCLHRF